MKLHELRIGNWYIWVSEGKEYRYQIERKDFANDNYKNFEPVQLTDELLLENGFFLDHETTFANTNNTHVILKRITLKNKPPMYEVKRKLFGETFLIVEYLHSLQNVYYDITGKNL